MKGDDGPPSRAGLRGEGCLGCDGDVAPARVNPARFLVSSSRQHNHRLGTSLQGKSLTATPVTRLAAL
jgi:hypothetical protein